MAKEFKKWIDEFVEHGANPKNVVKWPEEAGGTKVVTELPQVGEEHIIYELQEKKIIPSLIPMVNQQMIDDELVIELALLTFVFDTYDEMVTTITPLIPNEEIPLRFNYIIKEDKLIMSRYGGTDWQFVEATKVSDYKFDLSNALGFEEPAYVVILKEYLGKTSEESGDIRYNGKLLNDELYTFGANTVCIVLGAPTSGIMSDNVCMEGAEIPEDTPKELIFEYIPYEKIIKESEMQWVFKPNGIGEVTVSSYWIYTNETWFKADEIRKFKSQEKTVSPSTDTLQITPDKEYDGLSKVTVNPVTRNIDADIKAENIKKGVSILGVTGTYEASGGTYNISTLTSKIPQSLEEMGVAQIGSSVYLFGGDNGSSAINTIYKFDTGIETISTVSTVIPQALRSMGVAQIGSSVYLFGGYSADSRGPVNTICKFNVETEEIGTLSTTLPQALMSMGVAQIGSDVYLFGGDRGSGTVNTIYKFDTGIETISTLSARTSQATSCIGVAQVGSNVYLFQRAKIYKFNIRTETVTLLTVVSLNLLNKMGVAQVGGDVYLFGGATTEMFLTDAIYKFKVDF